MDIDAPAKDSPDIEGYRWRWMMQYCKQQGIPPAQSWAWKKAKEAFHIEHHSPDQEL